MPELTQKIRLLHCIETISSGGVERVRLSYARQMDKECFELKIVCTQAQGSILRELEFLGVEVLPIGTFRHPFEFNKYKKLLKIIKQYRPHIIHGAVFEGNSMAFVGKVFGRVPVAILEETSDPKFRSQKANWLLFLYSRFTNITIGISPAVIDYLKEIVGVQERKIKLIPNGVDIPLKISNEIQQSLRRELKIKEGDIIIGAVGRIYDKVKRFSDIIEAIHLLDLSNVKLILIGDGPDLEKLKIKVSNLGLEKQVLFLGYKSDPNPYYSLMDIFCVPSLQEGFGLVAVEAMLHQNPVIATKIGGLKDIVLDGKTGYLINSKSSIELGAKLKLLIHNAKLRKEMGINGFQRAISNYTSDIYAENLEKLYHTLLKKMSKN